MNSRTAAAAVALILAAQEARASCAAPANPVEAENCLPGNPQSEWDLPLSSANQPTAGDPTIQGFASDISYNPGDTVRFKINTDALFYSVTIYRMGYYGGSGARKITTVAPVPLGPQPACASDAATGLLDCGNWTVSASWPIPSSAASGIYFAKLVRSDTGGSSHVVFVVRDDAGRSDLLFQTSDTTWEAYNQYGGASLYTGFPASHVGGAYKVSYNRPFSNRDYSDNWVFTHEYPMVRFLEANGYDVSYFTGADSDRNGSLIRNHKVFLSVGHDEYWSGAQRAAVEAARAAGVHLAFLSGNSVYWKTRWEPAIDGSGAAYRTLVTYKESQNGRIDPQDPPTWTGFWRDFTASPPSDGGRPENALKGTLSTVGAYEYDDLQVDDREGKARFWRNTAVAALPQGSSVTFAGLVGYEWEEDIDNGLRPPGLVQLSSNTYLKEARQVGDPYLTRYSSGVATHHLTFYKHSSGALVFSAGSMLYSWGLDAHHDKGAWVPAEPPLQQATVNLLADMGAQPASPQAGLAPATPSADAVPPVSAIVFPAAGSSVPPGALVVVSGTASDSGGVPAGVEVSVDGGATWHPAQGTSQWTYQWTVPGGGQVTLKSRAVDDSGNLETPSSGVTVSAANPVPALAGISPASAAAGSSSFTLTATGAGFLPSSAVQWNGSARATAFVNSNTLTATIAAADISAPGPAAVTVFTPAPGGGTSSSQTFTIANPFPIFSSMSPSSTTTGGPGFTLTVNGANFEPTSTVQWAGTDRPTAFVSSAVLTAQIAAADIASARVVNITVTTPGPGGGATPFLTFTAYNAPPSLAAISPSSGVAGGSDFILTASGSGFGPSSVLQWNGSARATSFLNSNTLTATIAAADFAAPGSYAVTVQSPGPGGGTSSSQTFVAANPSPQLSGISPSTATAGGPGFTLVVAGSGFEPSSVVQWNGAARTTTFVSSATLNAAVSAGDIAFPGTATVSVLTPSPGGGLSTSAVFTIASPAVSISGLSPSSATAGGAPFTLTISGVGFVPQSVAQWNGAARPTTYVGPTTLTAAVSAADLAAPGSDGVTVFNPPPGGGTSAPASFPVANPAPLLSSMSPSSGTAGSAAFTMTLAGSNFEPNSIVRWNGAARPTAFVSSFTLTAQIPASDLAAPGNESVTVFSPSPGGGTSAAQSFTLVNPAPSVSALQPASIPAGGPAFTLTVNGTSFEPNSVVRWNGAPRATAFVSSAALTATIPASDTSVPGTAGVDVLTPAPGGGASASTVFTISNPAVSIAALSPSSAAVGGPGFTLTVTGANFEPSSIVQWNGAGRTTTFVSSSTLFAAITAGDVNAARSVQVTVLAPPPGGGTSAPAAFSVNDPVPALSRLSPSAATAGDSSFILTVNGAGFVPASTIQWNGSARATSFVSSAALTATITAADVSAAGTDQVSVFNPAPGGGASGSLAFTVSNPGASLASLSPSSATAGSPGFTLTVLGRGFVPSDTVQWNGSARPTAYASSTTLSASIPASDLGSVGTAQVTVFVPGPGGGPTNALAFLVVNPSPAISSLDPPSVEAGAPAFTLTVTGSNFFPGSTVLWNGSGRTTTFVSSSTLTAAISASDAASAQVARVSVLNPGPGGVSSTGASFPVLAPPPVTVDKVKLFPNPVSAHAPNAAAQIADAPANSTVRILSASGRLVKTFTVPGDTAVWDLKNEGGQGVASGIYIVVVTDGRGRVKRGTLAVK